MEGSIQVCWVQGRVLQIGEKWAEICGTKLLSTSTGTTAFAIALLAMALVRVTEVITTPFPFRLNHRVLRPKQFRYSWG
jgi:dTDP-4-amino-4,6-dideoxygalactose transaminase